MGSNRLTEEELQAWIDGGNPIMVRMATEIQERRATDLSNEEWEALRLAPVVLTNQDRDALKWARLTCWRGDNRVQEEMSRRTIAVLDRLIATHPEGSES